MSTPGDCHLRSPAVRCAVRFANKSTTHNVLVSLGKKASAKYEGNAAAMLLAPTFAYAHFAVRFAGRISGARCACFFGQKGRAAV